MQSNRSPEEEKGSLGLHDAELQPQLNPDDSRRVSDRVSRSTPSDESWPYPTPKKAMVSSAPGSEYWLP
jgi:hypothetical protein